MDFKAEIEKLLKKELGVKREVEVPPDSKMGDYAFPCFELAKTFKQNPNEIASDLAKKIKSKFIERIEFKGPYLNFFVNKKILAENLLKDIDEDYGKQKLKGKVVIDYSSPNIGKPMHIGHIRSTVIGDSLLKLFNFLGMKTVGINYLGDIGLHIGKLIIAYRLWVDKKALEKDPTKELLRLYVKFCNEEKSEVQENIDEDIGDNEWTNKAKEELRLIDLGNKDSIKIWKEIEKYSEKGFAEIYKKLNVKFDETTGQSKYSEPGKKIILDALKKKKAFEEQDGAIYVEFLDESRKYVLRSNKTASYITQDIGAAVDRFKKYKFTESIYVTDFRQKTHFAQLFKILEIFGYGSDKLKHVPFGTVKFGKEIIASRTGKLILLQEVIDKTIEKAEQEVKKRKTKGDPVKIGVGALKYAILNVSPVKDVEFSWEKALSFEGNTGPYLQYTYARASSILSKKKAPVKFKVPDLEEKEFELLKKMDEFPTIVEHAAKEYNPALIANYAFELATKFNEFYHTCLVIGSEQENFRLNIVKSFRFVIKNSLHLLGIEVMKEM